MLGVPVMPQEFRWTSDSAVQSPRILLAASREGAAIAAPLLPKYAYVESVYTVSDACAKLDERFNLVVLGIFFDDSRMFEVLHCVKHSKLNSDTPVLCFRPGESQYATLIDECTSSALKLLGADAFVDLSDRSRGQVEVFVAEVNSIIEKC
jgi:hypothetical protein